MNWQIVAEQSAKILPRIPLTLIVVAFGWLCVKVINNVVTKSLQRMRVEGTAITLVEAVINFVGFVVLFAAALNTLGLNELALALSGSIALVAMSIATSASNVTRDLIAGLYLLADDDFTVGTQIDTGAVKGVVKSLSIRKTKVIDAEGNIQIVPNREIDEKTFKVLKA